MTFVKKIFFAIFYSLEIKVSFGFEEVYNSSFDGQRSLKAASLSLKGNYYTLNNSQLRSRSWKSSILSNFKITFFLCIWRENKGKFSQRWEKEEEKNSISRCCDFWNPLLPPLFSIYVWGTSLYSLFSSTTTTFTVEGGNFEGLYTAVTHSWPLLSAAKGLFFHLPYFERKQASRKPEQFLRLIYSILWISI